MRDADCRSQARVCRQGKSGYENERDEGGIQLRSTRREAQDGRRRPDRVREEELLPHAVRREKVDLPSRVRASDRDRRREGRRATVDRDGLDVRRRELDDDRAGPTDDEDLEALQALGVGRDGTLIRRPDERALDDCGEG